MLFSDFPGQERATKLLSGLLETDRIPHALLFAGPEGCGKLGMAIAFAQALLCTDPLEDGSACGQCNQCIKSRKLEHPDLHFSFPYIGADYRSDDFVKEWKSNVLDNPYLNYELWSSSIKAENKQGKIYKKECVNIVKKLSFKRYEGRKKIMIIWLAEYLGIEGNRLLKIIEEPPEGTQFILVTEHTEKVLNTILSRCQLIKFDKISDIALSKYLVDNKNLSEDRARDLAFFSNGNMLNALNGIEQNTKGEFELFIDWLRKSYQGKPVELVAKAEELAALGKDGLKQVFHYGLQFLSEVNRLSILGREHSRLQGQTLEAADKLKGLLGLSAIDEMEDLLSKACYYVERNANAKILVLHMGIQMNAIFKKR